MSCFYKFHKSRELYAVKLWGSLYCLVGGGGVLPDTFTLNFIFIKFPERKKEIAMVADEDYIHIVLTSKR